MFPTLTHSLAQFWDHVRLSAVWLGRPITFRANDYSTSIPNTDEVRYMQRHQILDTDVDTFVRADGRIRAMATTIAGEHRRVQASTLPPHVCLPRSLSSVYVCNSSETIPHLTSKKLSSPQTSRKSYKMSSLRKMCLDESSSNNWRHD